MYTVNQGDMRLNTRIETLLSRFPWWTWVALLILIACLLRFPMLSSRPLWYDEAFSVLFAREGPSAMIYGTLTPEAGGAADVHPLLYYSLLWGWMKIFGQSIVAVRSLSILLSIFVLLALIALARMLFNDAVALVTGLLYALSPFQIHYAQEARMYVLLALLCVLATIYLIKASVSENNLQAVVFGIFSALAMYSHVLAVFFLVPLGLIILAVHRSRRSFQALLLGGGVGLSLYFPWLLQLPDQLARVEIAYWIQRPDLTVLIQTMLAFTSDLPVEPGMIPILLIASTLTFILLLIESWRGTKLARRDWILMPALVILPVLLLFLVSQVQPLYIIRGLLPSSVFFLLWLSWIIVKGRTRATVTLGVCVVCTFLVGNYSHLTYRGFPYAPFQTINESLASKVNGSTVILHTNKISMLPAFYDAPTLPHRYLQDPPGSGSDTLAGPTQEVLGLYEETDALSAVQEAERVFVVVFERELEDYRQLGFTEHPALTALDERYRVESTSNWDDIIVLEMVLDE